MMRQSFRTCILRPLALLALIVGFAIPATARAAGSGDSVIIEIRHVQSCHWTATVNLRNVGSVSAMTLPLRWKSGGAPFQLDSASYADSRLAYFAVKTFFPDTNARTILLGLISDLGRGLPPLEPGRGPIVRLHFTAPDPDADHLTLDTTFIAPHNVLQMVTPDIRAVYPDFAEVRIPETGTP